MKSATREESTSTTRTARPKDGEVSLAELVTPPRPFAYYAIENGQSLMLALQAVEAEVFAPSSDTMSNLAFYFHSQSFNRSPS